MMNTRHEVLLLVFARLSSVSSTYNDLVVAFKMLVLALLVLVVANGVRAQTATASLFPLVQANGLEGQIIGTGSDGTTYRLVGTYVADEIEIPFTATLVQDATHVSEIAILTASDVSIAVQAGCAFSSGQASCVETLIQPSSTSALTLSGSVSLQGVPIASGTGTATAISSQSQTTVSGSASVSGTGVSTLPASISASSSSASTATLITVSGSGTGTSTGAAGEATSTSSASTLRLGGAKHVVLALAFGALSAAFVMS